MVFHCLRENLPVKDEDFDKIYPEKISRLSQRHWTSVKVAKKAAMFLAPTADSKVMDVGSGAGKFCMVGSVTTPGHFFGVEQRQELVSVANDVVFKHNLDRVHFINANIMHMNLKGITALYLFNPFYENIDQEGCIDKSVPLSPVLYEQYEQHLFKQLDMMPPGTRLATYYMFSSQVPASYKLLEEHSFGMLRFYKKKKRTHHYMEKLINLKKGFCRKFYLELE